MQIETMHIFLLVAVLLFTGVIGFALGRTTLSKKKSDLILEIERLRTDLERDQLGHQEKVAELTSVKDAIEKDLKLLANEVVQKNSETFLKQAKEAFQNQHQLGEAEIENRRKAIEQLIKPLGDNLKTYRENLEKMERERKSDEGSIVQQLKFVAEAQTSLKDETGKLINALRAAPKTRGRWGEQQLKTVMEMAGMMEHVDFVTEHSIVGDEGAQLRPDAILRLPGERSIVIDAKTPMAAYLEAIEETDEDAREAKLRKHAKQLRTHMKQLSAKRYWEALADAPDFVVMFVPGENLFAAAIERDPDLLKDGVDSRVLIVTPTTFIALAQAIAFGWRQERISKNAQAVMELGQELYKRISQMGGKVVGLTKSIETLVGRHNDLIGTLEGRVLPQARKMHDMDASGSYGEIDTLGPVETDVREVRRDRDLTFDKQRRIKGPAS